jgi:uncharacterized membrane protein YraQ (UPF0718 family)
LAAIGCLIMLALIANRRNWSALSFIGSFPWASFKTVFISILLEAIPFVLLGVLFSALLQVFVSEQTIRRWTPRNPLLGVLFACSLGILFPLCECGMIPIVRSLMRKGMPVFIAVTFILAGPILNPVVYASTYMAFRSHPEIAYSRMALAFAVAAVIGLLVYRFVKRSPLLPDPTGNAYSHHHSHDHPAHSGGNDRYVAMHTHSERPDSRRPFANMANKLKATLSHASDEFFDMGKYLIFGAMLTAIIQTTVARDSLAAIGQGEFSSHLFMMGFAYVLSLCSTSDAFVASSFATTFTAGSLLTFLVFGPMLDLKNTLMLLSTFRIRFVVFLTLAVACAILLGSRAIELLFL